ncbi:nucleotidyltransferase domain-containing protein [Candidatus Pacearchaeota archaeon]|nr:nucleotidyltransferase domain-containing protein [Candidatus Pacearchaeota archaeon]
MNEKKPETLADNLSTSRNYELNKVRDNSEKEKQREDVNKLKAKLEDFKKKVVKKFSFAKVLGVLPANAAQMFEEDEAMPKEITETKPTHLIMIIPEEQYKNLNKIKQEVVQIVKDSGENFWIHIKTAEVDLWNYGLDSKYEFIDSISASFPLHDDGFLGALRVANIHKTLVLNWLNVGRTRYVATYAIGGSLVRGTADSTSDVDTFIIIDDTDVKRMSRIELLERLRGKIVSEFVKEASALAGVKNILNVQVYLLTDFWQNVKDANPVMFTFIRDGVPLYDRGTFIPWKRLLQMGRIKPSPEAIDLYMKEGERTNELVKRRMLDAMIDVYYGIVTPTQAMMMLSGHAPPVPKTIVEEVKKALVDKEKVMTMKELKTLEKVVKLFKDYEHGKLKEVKGKEIDDLVKEGEEYSKKMKEVRAKLEKNVQENQAEKIDETTFSLMKKIFGNKSKEALIAEMNKELIKKGKVQERMLSIVKEVSNLKKKVKTKKLSQSDIQRITRDAFELIDALTEYSQRKELVSLERGIVQINYNGKKAEVVATEEGVFVIFSDGKLKKIENKKFVETTREKFEEALSKTKEKLKFDFSSDVFETLRKELGEFKVLM